LDPASLRGSDAGVVIEHPTFALAGEGIFAHVDATPVVDFFDNVLGDSEAHIGAGYRTSATGP